MFRNLLEYYNNIAVWIFFINILANLVALYSLDESLNSRLVLVTSFNCDYVYVWRRRTFDKESVSLCAESCINCIVSVDYGSINICKTCPA